MTALRVVLALAMIALAVLQFGPKAAADTGEYALNEQFSLEAGGEARIRGEGLLLRFTDVPEDSRCPTEVLCYWTGRALVELQVERSGAATETVTFDTNPAPSENQQTVRVGDYRIELHALDPYPKTPESIAFDDYRATISVSKD